MQILLDCLVPNNDKAGFLIERRTSYIARFWLFFVPSPAFCVYQEIQIWNMVGLNDRISGLHLKAFVINCQLLHSTLVKAIRYSPHLVCSDFKSLNRKASNTTDSCYASSHYFRWISRLILQNSCSKLFFTICVAEAVFVYTSMYDDFNFLIEDDFSGLPVSLWVFLRVRPHQIV